MSRIPLKLIEVEKVGRVEWVDKATGVKPQPGDCFYFWDNETEPRVSFAPRFLADHSHAPRIVVLPTGQWWGIDQRAYKAPEYDDTIPHEEWAAKGWHGEGWSVTGKLPDITITPSIQVDGYHGFVTAGELHD